LLLDQSKAFENSGTCNLQLIPSRAQSMCFGMYVHVYIHTDIYTCVFIYVYKEIKAPKRCAKVGCGFVFFSRSSLKLMNSILHL